MMKKKKKRKLNEAAANFFENVRNNSPDNRVTPADISAFEGRFRKKRRKEEDENE